MKTAIKNGSNNLANNFRGSLIEAFELVKTFPKRFKEKSMAASAFSAVRLGSLPLAMHYVASNAATPGKVALDISALATGFVLSRLSKNEHIIAMDIPFVAILAAQNASVGEYGLATTMAAYGASAIINSMIPDEENLRDLRNMVTYGFTAIGCTAIATLAHTTSNSAPETIFESAAMLPLIFGSLSCTRLGIRTPQARMMQMLSNLSVIGIALSADFNVATAFPIALLFSNAVTSAFGYDIPRHKADGTKLSVLESAQAYLEILADSSKVPNYHLPSHNEDQDQQPPMPGRPVLV